MHTAASMVRKDWRTSPAPENAPQGRTHGRHRGAATLVRTSVLEASADLQILSPASCMLSLPKDLDPATQDSGLSSQSGSTNRYTLPEIPVGPVLSLVST